MLTLGEYIKQLRNEKKMPQRKLAESLDMDVAVLSRIENENKFPKKRMGAIIKRISKTFQIKEEELWICYLSDEVASIIETSDHFPEILKMAGSKILSKRTKKGGENK